MKILPLLLAGAMLTACEPLLPSGEGDDRDFGEVDPMQAPPGAHVLNATPIAGTDWLLAQTGWQNDRRKAIASSLDGYSGSAVANIVILDKTTGASVSLLPNERNLVRGHRIIWPVAGVVDGSPPDAAEGFAQFPPTHFMLDAELRGGDARGGPGARRLLIGSLDDFTSSLVARGYVAIHHMEMLDAERLSILLGYPDHDELLIVDLPRETIERRRWIDPARVAR